MANRTITTIDTYDFTDLERFITPLQNGYDLLV